MSSHPARPWVVGLAIALVVYAIGSIAIQWGRQNQVRFGSGAPVDTTDADAVVHQALDQIPAAPVDSTEIKTGWRDDVPGIDPATMTADQNEVFIRAANSQMCSCGCGFTLANCRRYDATCPVSGPRVEALRDSVRRGLVKPRGLRSRPASS